MNALPWDAAELELIGRQLVALRERRAVENGAKEYTKAASFWPLDPVATEEKLGAAMVALLGTVTAQILKAEKDQLAHARYRCFRRNEVVLICI